MKFTSMIFAASIALTFFDVTGSSIASLAVAQAATAQAIATERIQTFTVTNMTCALCPITVKTAMERLAGVKSAQVDFNAKTVTVVYDPAIVSPEAVAAAATNAGYPAKPVTQGN
ncbi:MAG: heavy-metal-associated domain-containing protein [Alphaproteobacteria bacterium]